MVKWSGTMQSPVVSLKTRWGVKYNQPTVMERQDPAEGVHLGWEMHSGYILRRHRLNKDVPVWLMLCHIESHYGDYRLSKSFCLSICLQIVRCSLLITWCEKANSILKILLTRNILFSSNRYVGKVYSVLRLMRWNETKCVSQSSETSVRLSIPWCSHLTLPVKTGCRLKSSRVVVDGPSPPLQAAIRRKKLYGSSIFITWDDPGRIPEIPHSALYVVSHMGPIVLLLMRLYIRASPGCPANHT